MPVRYLELADYLLIAEAVLGVPAATLARLPRIDLAESALNAPAAGFGGHEAYPTLEGKAAALCWHLLRNHPLPDGNKRCAFIALVEFLERNDRGFRQIEGDPGESDRVLRKAAAGELTATQLLDGWLVRRLL